MKLLRPFTITPGNLTSNIPQTDAPEYSAAATYAVGDLVMSTTGTAPTYRKYESLAAGNVGNALDDASKWLDLGPINRWAMFDTKNGTATVGSGNIEVAIQIDGRADGLALFGLDATSVRVQVAVDPALAPVPDLGATLAMDFTTSTPLLTVTTPDLLTTVYDRTFNLQSDSGITSWYSYFTEDIAYDTELVLTDLPLYASPLITVTIAKGGASTSCGTFVLGQTVELGGTVYGAKGGIQDYSRKETDDFGNYTLVQRAFAKRNTYRVVCENNSVDAIFNLLAEVRAVPVIWLGTDDYAFTWAFGWARDWAVEIAYPTKSFLTIEIEGLT